MPKVKIQCKKCGQEKEIYPSYLRIGRGKFCSKKCADTAKISGQKIEKLCKHCGEKFTFISHPNRKGYGVFCSIECKQIGITHTSDGYIMKYMPTHPYCSKKGYVKAHRYNMEQIIGRFLSPKEVVHHIDGDVTNNDHSNLMLFEDNGKHTKYHAKSNLINAVKGEK